MKTQIQLLTQFNQNHKIIDIIQKQIKNSSNIVLFGQYAITSYLGEGQFGKIFLVKHQPSKRDFALKIIDIQLINLRNPDKRAQQLLKRLLKTEQKLMKLCSQSRNVVKCYESYNSNKYKVLVTEYCNQGDLQRMLQNQHALTERDSILILRQIILGLAQLHRNKIIHRDLKPANILLHNGVCKITDFGLSKQVQCESQKIGTMCGSKNTMAPQVKNREPYGLKSDIWSIGMIYFLMVYPHCNYNSRFKEAQKLAYMLSPNFKFTTIQNISLSKQSVDFLTKTLKVNISERINWQQALEHPIFKKQFEKLPTIFIPVQKNQFELININQAQEFMKLQDIVDNKQQNNDLAKQINPQNQLKDQNYSQIMLEIIQSDSPYLNINSHLLECRKAQYIFDQIVLPLEKMMLEKKKDRNCIELFFLLTARCNNNVEFANIDVYKQYIKSQNITKSFKAQTQLLNQRTKEKFKKYSNLLTNAEDQLIEIIKDRFSKILFSRQFKEKEKFFIGFERTSYEKQDQVEFTYQEYILPLIKTINKNKIEEYQDMIKKLKCYKKINQICLQEIKNLRLNQRIEQIIKN